MKILSEFKRRNVHRMAALYLAAAWLVMQVLDVVEGKLPLPDWMGSAVLAVLAVGFPIALIISWFYEVTPEGISRDTDEQPAESAAGFTGRRVDFVIIAVLAAALLVVAYDKWWLPPPPAPPERSVAVLPFANMSADEDSAYFAEGVADTILNMLAQVPELHVAARTSSFQPRLIGLGAREIGSLLGVTAVLEGSVQRHGDTLRITAQLINAEDASHLWSRNFDRDYSDVFAIQDEIAEAVTSALELSFQGETKQRIDREGTDNLQAFEEYSKAIENLRSKTTESVRLAVEQLERAIEFDPNFARAHAMLGYTYLNGYYGAWSELDREEIRARARQQANTALRIAPGMSTALALLGDLTDDDAARAQLYREAVENGPNDTLALRRYARHLFFDKLQVDEAAELLEKVIRLDPLDELNWTGLAMKQAWRNQPRACLETLSRGMEKVPESVALRDAAATCYFGLGEYRSALVSKYETLEFDPREYWNRYEIGLFYLLVGMPDEAERWIESAAAHAPEGHFTHRINPMLLDMYYQRNDEEVFAALKPLLSERGLSNIFGSVTSLFIEYGARLGRLDEVLATFEELYPHLFADLPDLQITSFWDDYGPLSATGFALLRSGDVRRGDLLMRAVLEKDAMYDRVLALCYCTAASLLALGETEAALEKFRAFAANSKFYMGLAGLIELRYSSLFDPIRDEPEFIALLDEYDKNAAEQRRLLQAMDLPVR